MYSLLGYLSAILLLLLMLPYLLRILKIKAINNKLVKDFLKLLRKNHKLLGVAMLLISAIHGYMALRTFKLHTGTLLYLCLILSAIFGMIFVKKKKKSMLVMHRTLALCSIGLLAIHFFFPSAIYYIGLWLSN